MYVLNSDLPEKLIEAMSWELETRHYCEKLLNYADNGEDREDIYYIIENEIKHYCILNELYIYLLDKRADIPDYTKAPFEDYAKGIEMIAKNIKYIYCFYRDIHIKSKSPYVQTIFSGLAQEESSHISLINHLYAKVKWM